MKVPVALNRACRLLKKRVMFESASFDLHKDDEDIRMSSDEDTKAIKDATRLYTESWVLPIIDAIQKGDMGRLDRITRNEGV